METEERFCKLLKFLEERQNDSLIWRDMSRGRERLRAGKKRRIWGSGTCDVSKRAIFAEVTRLRVTGKLNCSAA
jgi:hypothetical protein